MVNSAHKYFERQREQERKAEVFDLLQQMVKDGTAEVLSTIDGQHHSLCSLYEAEVWAEGINA